MFFLILKDGIILTYNQRQKQSETMPKFMPGYNKSDKIDVLNYAININVPKGQCRRITNINKAPVHIIDKLLQEKGVDEDKFNDYYYIIKNKEVVARDMFNHQQKLLAEQRKIDEEFRQMEDEDFRSQFCSLPDEIKLICKKKSEYENYCIYLKAKNIHIKKTERMFNYREKRSNLDTLTWRDGNAELFVNGMKIHMNYFRTPINCFRDIHRQKATKEIIEDYKNGLIPVWFKIKNKVKKNRRTKV